MEHTMKLNPETPLRPAEHDLRPRVLKPPTLRNKIFAGWAPKLG